MIRASSIEEMLDGAPPIRDTSAEEYRAALAEWIRTGTEDDYRAAVRLHRALPVKEAEWKSW